MEHEQPVVCSRLPPPFLYSRRRPRNRAVDRRSTTAGEEKIRVSILIRPHRLHYWERLFFCARFVLLVFSYGAVPLALPLGCPLPARASIRAPMGANRNNGRLLPRVTFLLRILIFFARVRRLLLMLRRPAWVSLPETVRRMRSLAYFSPYGEFLIDKVVLTFITKF